MSFRREGDNCVITLTRAQYDSLLMACGMAIGAMASREGILSASWLIRLVNTMNDGNPGFQPYEVPRKDTGE